MPNLPTLPAEIPYTDLEQHFIESSPDGLWPDNQDSNFGQIRRCLTDILQECADLLTILNQELTVATASRYLSLWEEQIGLPTAPAGWTDQQRRSVAIQRRRYGPFTRARRAALVEDFIAATFGESTSFGVSGIPLSAGGTPMLSGAFSFTGLYKIVEHITTFSYTIYIKNTVAVDNGALTRALNRVTPAHLSFDIQYVADPTIF